MSLTVEILDLANRRAVAKGLTYSQLLAHLTEALAIAAVNTATVIHMPLNEMTDSIHLELDETIAEVIYGPHKHTTH